MPNLIIFDCDGVLLESECISCSNDAEELTKAGFPYTAEEVAEQFLGVALVEMLKMIEVDHGRPLPPGFLQHLKDTTTARFDAELTAVEGVGGMLELLHLPRCVASSSDFARLHHSLGLVGLLDQLQPHIFSADQVARGKPEPDLFLHAAETMGHAPDRCLVIEDSLVGVAAGRAAGMTVLGFVGASHIPLGHDERLREAGAHKVFDSMADLPSLIGAFA